MDTPSKTELSGAPDLDLGVILLYQGPESSVQPVNTCIDGYISTTVDEYSDRIVWTDTARI